MKKLVFNQLFRLFFTMMFLFTCTNTLAQITVIKTIDNPSEANVFLGAANMDNDPQEELIYCEPGGTSSIIDKIVIIDGSSGAYEWESPDLGLIYIAGREAGTYNTSYSSPFCDLNNDGLKEITFCGLKNGIYKIFVVGLQGTAGQVGNNNSIPNQISLSQNYPNPFNPTTTIEYQVQENDLVTLKIYDSIGQLVRTLVNEEKPSGEYSVIFDGKNEKGQSLSSGAYFYQLKVGDFISSKKMIMLK